MKQLTASLISNPTQERVLAYKTSNRENDITCTGITDSCPSCGRPHIAHPIAKISKVKE